MSAATATLDLDGLPVSVEWSEDISYWFTPEEDDPEYGWIAGRSVYMDMTGFLVLSVEVKHNDRAYWSRVRVAKSMQDYPEILSTTEGHVLWSTLLRAEFTAEQADALRTKFAEMRT